MLTSCDACPGFVPPCVDHCPHCGSSAKSAAEKPRSLPFAIARTALKVAKASGVGVAMVTLMACYGISAPPLPECRTDSDCATGICNTDSGICTNQRESCTDGVDNDSDGLIDCNDSDCAVACTREVSCTNGIDDDHDGKIDCADPDCSASCTHETSCSNGIDDDHDGLVDCKDPDCGASCATKEGNCFDNIDDDHDGLVDCNHPDCIGQCTGHEANCSDGIDDDKDTFIDCADPDCLPLAVCGGHEITCDNGLDDDKDGLVDCQDPDCPSCATTETHCNNGFDDDLDGLADCLDPDCALDPSCATSGTCGDGKLDPGESCDDDNSASGDGCSATCSIEVTTYCANLPVLVSGATQASTVGGAGGFSAACVATGGPERGYAFIAPADGKLYLTLDATTDLGVYVNLGCGSFATPLGCANAVPAGQLETLELVVPAGAPLTIYVDGATPGSAGAFTLLATFVPG